MKIREDLVFDKTSKHITGFVDFGKCSLNDHLTALRDQCSQQRKVIVDRVSVATYVHVDHNGPWSVFQTRFSFSPVYLYRLEHIIIQSTRFI